MSSASTAAVNEASLLGHRLTNGGDADTKVEVEEEEEEVKYPASLKDLPKCGCSNGHDHKTDHE
jgi:hypothetical protein